MMVLQPDSWHWFVNSEQGHPLLPAGADLYLVSSATPHSSSASKPQQQAARPMTAQHPAAAPKSDQLAQPSQRSAESSGSRATQPPVEVRAGASKSNGNGNGSKAPRESSPLVVANNITGYVPGNGKPSSTQLVSMGSAARTPVHSAQDAMWALMDNPHPLDTLADPGAYLERGSISRYHNPGETSHTSQASCTKVQSSLPLPLPGV